MLIDYDTLAGASQPEALTLLPMLFFITLFRFSLCPISSTARFAFSWFWLLLNSPLPFSISFSMFLILALSVSFTLKVSGTSKTERKRHVTHTSHSKLTTYNNLASFMGPRSLYNDARVVPLIGAIMHAHTEVKGICKFAMKFKSVTMVWFHLQHPFP